jgi:hypothetical protein
MKQEGERKGRREEGHPFLCADNFLIYPPYDAPHALVLPFGGKERRMQESMVEEKEVYIRRRKRGKALKEMKTRESVEREG